MAKAATKKAAPKSGKQDAPKQAFYAKCGKGSRCKRDGAHVIARDDFKSAKDGKHYHRECLPKGHEFASPISLSPKAKKAAKAA